MSTKLLIVIVLWALALFATPVVLDYSSRWDSHANPIRDVTVEFASGEKLTGDLSTDWSGMKVLHTADRIVTFRLEAIAGMTAKVPRPADPNTGYFARWRLAAGPAVLLSIMVLLASSLTWPRRTDFKTGARP